MEHFLIDKIKLKEEVSSAQKPNISLLLLVYRQKFKFSFYGI